MVEFFLPFLLGYAVARLTSFMVSANQESRINENSVLLRWDKETLAWRPCPISTINDPAIKYMVAAPVDYETVKFIKSVSEKNV